MPTTAQLLTIAAAALLTLTGGAEAATTTVHFCDDATNTAPIPSGPAWGTHVAGDLYTGDFADGAYPAAELTCFTVAGHGIGMTGPGGFTSNITPGTIATATFTPPAGTRIVSVNVKQWATLGTNPYTNASIRTATGRVLNTVTDPYLNGTPLTLDAAALGADGGAGLSWGIRCPSPLPSGATSCSGGIFSLTGTITIADRNGDQSPAAPTAQSPAATGTSPEPQSVYLPAVPAERPAAKPAPSSVPLVPANVTLQFARRHGGRSLRLSGVAAACASVSVRLPNGTAAAATVVKGSWHANVRPRRGTYVARCSTATVTRVRR